MVDLVAGKPNVQLRNKHSSLADREKKKKCVVCCSKFILIEKLASATNDAIESKQIPTKPLVSGLNGRHFPLL